MAELLCKLQQNEQQNKNSNSICFSLTTNEYCLLLLKDSNNGQVAPASFEPEQQARSCFLQQKHIEANKSQLSLESLVSFLCLPQIWACLFELYLRQSRSSNNYYQELDL